MYCVFILIPVILGVGALDEGIEKIMNHIGEVGVVCAQKENATPEDLLELTQGHYPLPTHTAKCVVACMFETFEVLKPNGTLDKQGAIEFFKRFETVDPDLYTKLLQAVDKCYKNPKIFEDRCETVSEVSICVLNEIRNLGVDTDVYVG